MVILLLLLLLVVVMVVPVGDVAVEVVVDFVLDMIFGEVVALEVMGLTNALIVAVVFILWSFVGTYMAHHLDLPIRLLFMRILRLQLDTLLDWALLSRMISSLF